MENLLFCLEIESVLILDSGEQWYEFSMNFSDLTVPIDWITFSRSSRHFDGSNFRGNIDC